MLLKKVCFIYNKSKPVLMYMKFLEKIRYRGDLYHAIKF